jgi:hypothetical protein
LHDSLLDGRDLISPCRISNIQDLSLSDTAEEANVQQSNYAQVGTVKDIAYFLGSFHLEKAN